MTSEVTVHIDGGVAVLTLNRPERRNAYTAEMGALLGRAYRECDRDDDVRAIVLTGAGSRSRRRRSTRPPSRYANR